MAANNNFKNRPSNYVIFTLMAIADGEMKVSQSGKPFAFTRAFLSQGKDKTSGEYRPSLFFDVKAFSKDDSVTALVQNIADVQNKDRSIVKGRLGMEEWEGQDGVKHQEMVIFASSIEPFTFDENEAALEEDLEGEPVFQVSSQHDRDAQDMRVSPSSRKEISGFVSHWWLGQQIGFPFWRQIVRKEKLFVYPQMARRKAKRDYPGLLAVQPPLEL